MIVLLRIETADFVFEIGVSEMRKVKQTYFTQVVKEPQFDSAALRAFS